MPVLPARLTRLANYISIFNPRTDTGSPATRAGSRTLRRCRARYRGYRFLVRGAVRRRGAARYGGRLTQEHRCPFGQRCLLRRSDYATVTLEALRAAYQAVSSWGVVP